MTDALVMQHQRSSHVYVPSPRDDRIDEENISSWVEGVSARSSHHNNYSINIETFMIDFFNFVLSDILFARPW